MVIEMRRLFAATTVFVLTGLPALGAVCVTACLPGAEAHHAAAAPSAPAAHDHDHQADSAHAAHITDSRALDAGPASAMALVAVDAASDCPCCAAADGLPTAVLVAPRAIVLADAAPAVAVPGLGGHDHDRRAVILPRGAPGGAPPISPPATLLVLRI